MSKCALFVSSLASTPDIPFPFAFPLEFLSLFPSSGVTGDFFRPLVPGSYQVAVEADGYEVSIKAVNISRRAVHDRRAQILNFRLRPLPPTGEEEQEMMAAEQPERETMAGGEAEEREAGEEALPEGPLSPEQV